MSAGLTPVHMTLCKCILLDYSGFLNVNTAYITQTGNSGTVGIKVLVRLCDGTALYST